MTIMAISMPLDLADEIEKIRVEMGFLNGALIFKRSPLVCELIKIGIKHRNEIDGGNRL